MKNTLSLLPLLLTVATAAAAESPPHQKCTNVRSATRLDPSLPTLAQVLKGASYATAHFGKWHLGREPHSPLELGFDVDIPHWYWQELSVPLAVEGRVVHVRLFLSESKKSTEIDWIEIVSNSENKKDRKRWDFNSTTKP